MPKTIEQRLEDLEETVKLLYSVVIEGKPYIPGEAELDRALRAAAFQGDIEPLNRYMKAGGVLPDVPDHRRMGTFEGREANP